MPVLQTEVPRLTTRDFINCKKLSVRFPNQSELFSGLFFVAASRLNSPRFLFVLIRPRPRECQAGEKMFTVWFPLGVVDKGRSPAGVSDGQLDAEGRLGDASVPAFRLCRLMCGRSLTFRFGSLCFGLCPHPASKSREILRRFTSQ